MRPRMGGSGHSSSCPARISIERLTRPTPTYRKNRTTTTITDRHNRVIRRQRRLKRTRRQFRSRRPFDSVKSVPSFHVFEANIDTVPYLIRQTQLSAGDCYRNDVRLSRSRNMGKKKRDRSEEITRAPRNRSTNASTFPHPGWSFFPCLPQKVFVRDTKLIYTRVSVYDYFTGYNHPEDSGAPFLKSSRLGYRERSANRMPETRTLIVQRFNRQLKARQAVDDSDSFSLLQLDGETNTGRPVMKDLRRPATSTATGHAQRARVR